MNISFEHPIVRVVVDADEPWVPNDVSGFFNSLKQEYQIEVILKKNSKVFVSAGTLSGGQVVIEFLKQLLQYGKSWDFEELHSKFAAQYGDYGTEFLRVVMEFQHRVLQCINASRQTIGRDNFQP